MRTLSLDLRGFGASRTLSGEAPTRSAFVSILIHGAGICALVLVPLLGSSNPPETADASNSPLVQPITLAPPSPPMTGSRPLHPSSKPRSSRSVITPLDTPTDVPEPVRAGDVLDSPTSPLSISASSDGRDGSRFVGDCLLGTLCGDAAVPIAGPMPIERPRVGGIIKEPRLIESRPPLYPAVAQAAGLSGLVILEVHVGSDGRVRGAEIVRGDTLFDQSALTSVRSRRYEPLLLNGVPTDFLITVTVVFNIKR